MPVQFGIPKNDPLAGAERLSDVPSGVPNDDPLAGAERIDNESGHISQMVNYLGGMTGFGGRQGDERSVANMEAANQPPTATAPTVRPDAAAEQLRIEGSSDEVRDAPIANAALTGLASGVEKGIGTGLAYAADFGIQAGLQDWGDRLLGEPLKNHPWLREALSTAGGVGLSLGMPSVKSLEKGPDILHRLATSRAISEPEEKLAGSATPIFESPGATGEEATPKEPEEILEPEPEATPPPGEVAAQKLAETQAQSRGGTFDTKIDINGQKTSVQGVVPPSDARLGETAQPNEEYQSAVEAGDKDKAEEAIHAELQRHPDASVYNMKVKDMKRDPERFQYKTNVAAGTGADAALSGVEHYDRGLGNIVTTYHDNDGQYYTVNGHGRVAKLEELEGPEATHRAQVIESRQKDDPDAVKGAIRYGFSPDQARDYGAVINIAEGRGTAMDAARFFRQKGMTTDAMKSQGIALNPVEEKTQRAVSLSRLSGPLFRAVDHGVVPEKLGVVIGRELGDSPEAQNALYARLKNQDLNNLSARRLDTWIKLAKSSGVSTDKMMTLFGEEEMKTSLMNEQADVIEGIQTRLRTEKKLFGKVAEGASEIEKAGVGKVDPVTGRQISEKAAYNMAVFEANAYSKGPVNEAIREAAQKLRDNPKSKAKILTEAYDRVSGEMNPAKPKPAAATEADMFMRRSPGEDPQSRESVRAKAEAQKTAARKLFKAPAIKVGDKVFEGHPGQLHGQVASDHSSEIFSRTDKGAQPESGFVDHDGKFLTNKEASDKLGAMMDSVDLITPETEKAEEARDAAVPLGGDKSYASAKQTFAKPLTITTDKELNSYLSAASAKALTDPKATEAERAKANKNFRGMLMSHGYDGVVVDAEKGASSKELRKMVGKNRAIGFERKEGDPKPATTFKEPGTVMGVGLGVPIARGIDRIRQAMPENIRFKPGQWGTKLKETFAPETAGAFSQRVADIWESKAAELRARIGSAGRAMQPLREHFQGLIESARVNLASQMEKGDYSALPPELKGFGTAMKEITDQVHDRLGKLTPDQKVGYVENYWRHMWANKPDEVKEAFQRISTGKGLAVGGGFLKGRRFPTIQEGVDAGLTPKYSNPVDQWLAGVQQEWRYVTGKEIWGAIKDSGIARYVRVTGKPERGYAKIDDPISRVMAPTDKGIAHLGDWYVPEDVARIMNNHLHPGLPQNPFSSLSALGNQIRVEFSGFHFLLTSLSNIAQGVGDKFWDGLGDIAHGNVGRGALKMALSPARVATGPMGIYRDWRGGRDVITKALGGHFDDPAVRDAILGGASFDYGFDNPAHLIADGWKNAFGIPQKMADRLGATMKHWVAPLKVGMQLRLYNTALKRAMVENGNQELSFVQRRALATQTRKHLDNVMGQINRDNLHFSNGMKDALHLAVSYPGWQIGTLRLLGGSARGLVKGALKPVTGGKLDMQAQQALRFTTGMLITGATVGTVANMLMTGEAPKSVSEMFLWPTGEKDANGNQIRTEPPEYLVRDLLGAEGNRRKLSSGDVLAWPKAIGESAISKMNWPLAAASYIMRNADFFGRPITFPDLESQPKQIRDIIGEFLKEGGVPFAAKNVGELMQEGKSPARSLIAGAAGLTPESRALRQTPAQNFLDQHRDPQQQPLSPQQSQRDELLGQFEGQVRKQRAGGPAVDMGPIKDAIRSGIVTPDEVQRRMTNATRRPFANQVGRAPLPIAMQAWKMARDNGDEADEKDAERAVITKISSGELTKLPPDQRRMIQGMLVEFTKSLHGGEDGAPAH